jgi:para-nitrobenzyl esterase
MSAASLLRLNGAFAPASRRAAGGIAFPTPTIDGFVLPRQPRQAFETGAFRAVPTIIGHNADEGRMFNAEAMSLTAPAYRALVARRFGVLSQAVLDAYPSTDDAGARAAMTAIIGDAEFNEGARLIARALAGAQPRTFAYLFTRAVAGAGPPPTHSEELAFVFGTLDAPSFIGHAPPRPADLALSRTMRAAWARFAAAGDPNGPGLPAWPAYDAARDPYLDFGDAIQPGEAFRQAPLDVMRRVNDAAAAP